VISKVVVSDSGPLHYLALTDCADILQSLFEEVIIPPAVRSELLHPRAPAKVREWIAAPRPWLSVRRVSTLRAVAGLHKGEAAALQLALEAGVSAVLMDDLDARNAARRLGLMVVGTVGILEVADEKHLIQLPAIIEKLRRTNFFISPQVVDAALERRRIREEDEH
jgi:predicted nucleic acid-binding protein